MGLSGYPTIVIGNRVTLGFVEGENRTVHMVAVLLYAAAQFAHVVVSEANRLLPKGQLLIAPVSVQANVQVRLCKFHDEYLSRTSRNQTGRHLRCRRKRNLGCTRKFWMIQGFTSAQCIPAFKRLVTLANGQQHAVSAIRRRWSIVPAYQHFNATFGIIGAMHTHIVVLFFVLATAFTSTVQATPLEDIHKVPVSRLELGSFRLEVALAGIKDWPFPIDGAGVSFKVNPDQIAIVVAVTIARDESFRTACTQTLGRVRKLLYVDANGNPPMGRSYLNSYFRGSQRSDLREADLRALDENTLIRVDVVKRGSCQAALTRAPIKFETTPQN